MRPRFVRCRYAYVRVDTASAIIVPFMAMAVAIAAGQTILALGLVKSIYASPFVALCALVSNRVCLRSGLITAFLAMIGYTRDELMAGVINQRSITRGASGLKTFSFAK